MVENKIAKIVGESLVTDFSKKLYIKIRHGNKEHKRWLREEIKNFVKEYLNNN